jgi:hypothetical protein
MKLFMKHYFVKAEYRNSTGNKVSRYFFVQDINEESAYRNAKSMLIGVGDLRNLVVEPHPNDKHL